MAFWDSHIPFNEGPAYSRHRSQNLALYLTFAKFLLETVQYENWSLNIKIKCMPASVSTLQALD